MPAELKSAVKEIETKDASLALILNKPNIKKFLQPLENVFKNQNEFVTWLNKLPNAAGSFNGTTYVPDDEFFAFLVRAGIETKKMRDQEAQDLRAELINYSNSKLKEEQMRGELKTAAEKENQKAQQEQKRIQAEKAEKAEKIADIVNHVIDNQLIKYFKETTSINGQISAADVEKALLALKENLKIVLLSDKNKEMTEDLDELPDKLYDALRGAIITSTLKEKPSTKIKIQDLSTEALTEFDRIMTEGMQAEQQRQQEQKESQASKEEPKPAVETPAASATSTPTTISVAEVIKQSGNEIPDSLKRVLNQEQNSQFLNTFANKFNDLTSFKNFLLGLPENATNLTTNNSPDFEKLKTYFQTHGLASTNINEDLVNELSMVFINQKKADDIAAKEIAKEKEANDIANKIIESVKTTFATHPDDKKNAIYGALDTILKKSLAMALAANSDARVEGNINLITDIIISALNNPSFTPQSVVQQLGARGVNISQASIDLFLNNSKSRDSEAKSAVSQTTQPTSKSDTVSTQPNKPPIENKTDTTSQTQAGSKGKANIYEENAQSIIDELNFKSALPATNEFLQIRLGWNLLKKPLMDALEAQQRVLTSQEISNFSDKLLADILSSKTDRDLLIKLRDDYKNPVLDISNLAILAFASEIIRLKPNLQTEQKAASHTTPAATAPTAAKSTAFNAGVSKPKKEEESLETLLTNFGIASKAYQSNKTSENLGNLNKAAVELNQRLAKIEGLSFSDLSEALTDLNQQIKFNQTQKQYYIQNIQSERNFGEALKKADDNYPNYKPPKQFEMKKQPQVPAPNNAPPNANAKATPKTTVAASQSASNTVENKNAKTQVNATTPKGTTPQQPKSTTATAAPTSATASSSSQVQPQASSVFQAGGGSSSAAHPGTQGLAAQNASVTPAQQASAQPQSAPTPAPASAPASASAPSSAPASVPASAIDPRTIPNVVPNKQLDIKDINQLKTILESKQMVLANLVAVTNNLLETLDEKHELRKAIVVFRSSITGPNASGNYDSNPDDLNKLKAVYSDLMQRSKDINNGTALDKYHAVAERLHAEAKLQTGTAGERHRQKEKVTEETCQKMLDVLVLQEAELRDWREQLDRADWTRGAYQYRSHQEYQETAKANQEKIEYCRSELVDAIKIIQEANRKRVAVAGGLRPGETHILCFNTSGHKDFDAASQQSGAVTTYIDNFMDDNAASPAVAIISPATGVQSSLLQAGHVDVNLTTIKDIDDTILTKSASIRGEQDGQYKLKIRYNAEEINNLPLHALLKQAVIDVNNYYTGLSDEDRKFPMKLEGVPAKLAKAMIIYCKREQLPIPVLDIPYPKQQSWWRSQESAEKAYSAEVAKTFREHAEYIFGDRTLAPLARAQSATTKMKEEAHVTEEEVKTSSSTLRRH